MRIQLERAQQDLAQCLGQSSNVHSCLTDGDTELGIDRRYTDRVEDWNPEAGEGAERGGEGQVGN